MISIKDYANNKGVSTQAVYKQLKHHEQQLEGFIVKLNRTRYLTDEAIDYLNSQSEQTPSVILQADNSERMKQLEEENRNLLLKVAELQETIIKKSEKIEQLQEANILLLETKHDGEKQKGFWGKFLKR